MALRIKRPDTAFSLDTSRKSQGGRLVDGKHLAFVRSLVCLATGSEKSIEAAHVRYADPAYSKPGTPLARKPDDRWTVPLCAEAHRTGNDSQHSMKERDFWQRLGIDPLAVAEALWQRTGDRDAGLQIIADARARIAPWKKGSV